MTTRRDFIRGFLGLVAATAIPKAAVALVESVEAAPALAQTVIDPNHWYHIAVTKQKGTIRCFVDGTLSECSELFDEDGMPKHVKFGDDPGDRQKFGSASVMFDGTDDYLELAGLYSDDFNFGKDNFTLDYWIKFNGTVGDNYYMDEVRITKEA